MAAKTRRISTDGIKRFMDDLSSTDSTDEYLSPGSPATPFTRRTLHAGLTPGHKFRRDSSKYSPGATRGRHRHISVDFSGLIDREDVERVIKATTAHRCLFGTLHVKAATAILTVMYLLVVLLVDRIQYDATQDTRNNDDYIVFASINVLILAAVVSAQYGLYRQRYGLLIPFALLQMVILAVLLFTYGTTIIRQVAFAEHHPESAVRLGMLVLSEALIVFLHGYSILVTVRCMCFLHAKSKIVPKVSWANQSFFHDLQETGKKPKKDEEIVLFSSDETKLKKPSMEKEKQSTVNNAGRYVRFVDVKATRKV